ncbi:hypothetical protein [Endozoicomonas sp. 8E]|uniref:hypothetical protein n=1 Tax=Endozoicomonas sp. 8E TaxID=3035692 RepID=UPI00293903AC|nr:hypothetical protein [Endozoicomonas sp. 8E]WOG27108.1 hypothetical protein P6910_21535 [Endozoicomonas sp. 8E]
MTESECKQRIIKHPIFAAPLLLLVSLSAACQAELLTRRFIVELETDEGTLKQNLSIKRSWQTLPENLSEIGNTDTYPGSVSPPDRKRHNLYSYGVKTTLTESISWQLLYATNLLVDFELILTTKDTPICTNPHSCIALGIVVVVDWLLKSYWSPDSLLFKPIQQMSASMLAQADHPLATITALFGSEHNPQQYQSSESSGQQASRAPSYRGSSFTSPLNTDYGDGNNGPQPHSHTLGLNCYVYPCQGICQFQPSYDSSGLAEWSLNPPVSSCPHLFVGYCLDCISRSDPLNTTDFKEKSHFGTLNDLPDVQLPFDSDTLFGGTDGNSIGRITSERATDTKQAVGPINNHVAMLGSLPSTINDGSIYREATDISHHDEINDVFITLDHLEQQPTSSQLDQSQPHLSKIGAIQAATQIEQTVCDVTVTRKDGWLQLCGRHYKSTRALSDHKRRNHCGQKTCNAIVVGEDRQLRPCGTICKNLAALCNHKRSSHSEQKTCEAIVVGENGQLRPCRTVCKNARSFSDHKRNYHGGQRTCDVTIIGEDGQQRPCGTVCKNPLALSSHKNNAHIRQQNCNVIVFGKDGQIQPCRTLCKNTRSLLEHKRRQHSGEKTCDAIVVGEDAQLRPCGTVWRNARALSDHTKKYHSEQKTCAATIVGEDGQLRPCGTICKSVRALSDHKRSTHSGQKTCQMTVVGKDGQPRPCGMVCKSAKALSDHKSRAHSKQKTCDVTVVGMDGEQRPCGRVCSSSKVLFDHKRDIHSRQDTCHETVVSEDGQLRPCEKVCKNNQALRDHKKRHHSRQRICDVAVVGESGQLQPCGKVCKSYKVLSDHKRIHRKRKPADVDLDDD